MCAVCNARHVQRRGFLSLTAAGLSGALLGPAAQAGPSSTGSTSTPTLSPDDALARLQAGNAAFLDAPALCAARLGTQRTQSAQHQAPWATVISCADSRVPPELLFGGLGLGQLFVVRNAGHLADVATLGTIEYGWSVLGVPLVVVLGHERCGAVAAACEAVQKGTRFPGHIGPLVDSIVPAARAVQGRPGDFLDNAVRENARRTARHITARSATMAQAVAQGRARVVAAHYDLDSGEVQFLD